MTSEKDHKPITAEELIDLQVPSNVRLSPSGTHIVYTTKAQARKDDHDKRALWLAEFGVEKSARQLTSGSYNDRNPEWSPDSKTIAFISDREKEGKTCAIYMLSIAGGEAYAVTDTTHEANISGQKWSPNGRFIAFTSANEKSEEKKAKDEKKDDVMVYGEDWRYERLRILHVATREVTTLFEENANVGSFVWSEESKQIAIATTKTTEIDSMFLYGSRIEVVSVTSRSKKTVLELDGAVLGDMAWVEENRILFQSGIIPSSCCTSGAIYALDIKAGKHEVIAHGRTDDAAGLQGIPGGGAAVHAIDGLDDQISIVGGETLHRVQQDLDSFDVVKTKEDKHLLAFTTSTISSPPEVFSKSSTGASPIQLSDHGASIRARLSATFKPLSCTSFDGKVELDGIWAAPTSAPSGPLPTLLYLHGGPYYRSTNSFSGYSGRWMPWLMSQNRYGLLTVNYRGSSGKGNAFAAEARGGMGTTEYDDVLSIVEEAIAQGLVDKNRLVVGGWSQGGFLSYLSAVRNGATKLPNGQPKTWRFAGAICGAGVTDWDMMSMSSDTPAFESELAGSTPWGTSSKTDTSARQGGAIWEFEQAAREKSIPPILILHGERDERVPLSQAVAFHRGCLKYGVQCEMAVYPREPHGFKERAHSVDVLKRLLRFLDEQIGG